jgi:putative transposase
MILSHKIALDPTEEQREYFARACGTSRFVYNWALNQWNLEYQLGNKPTANKLKKQFNQIYPINFPWISDTHRDCHSQPFTNLQKAFSNFFKKKAKYPQFKKKNRHDSFYIANDRFWIENKIIRLPVIGEIKLRESLRFEGKIVSATVGRKANRWHVSVQVDVGDYHKDRVSNNKIGLDLGIKIFAVTSSGIYYDAPRPLRSAAKRLARAQRILSRRKKGGQNRKKQIEVVAKIHARVSSIRNDFLHKLSTQLCCKNQAIAIEDLNVSGIMKNHKLARSVSDQGWSEFRRQLTYKSEIYGNQLVTIDRWFPSSKICSNCGNVKIELTLSDRDYLCDSCHYVIDRDWNAAINIRTHGGWGIHAHGQ